MDKCYLCFMVLSFLISCQNKKEIGSTFKGKWEAEYVVNSDADTTFYDPATSTPCAYLLIPGEYSSGFEITDDAKGELIWCGRNKEQYFTWSYKEKILTVTLNDQATDFKIENPTDTAMDLIAPDGKKYHMKKY